VAGLFPRLENVTVTAAAHFRVVHSLQVREGEARQPEQ